MGQVLEGNFVLLLAVRLPGFFHFLATAPCSMLGQDFEQDFVYY